MKKKYKKIIVFILITLLTISTFTSVSSKNTTLNDDKIDQEQTQTSGKDYIYNGHWRAQSFKPTASILTRIQLYINKNGAITSDFQISIKKTLTGEELTNYSLSSNIIPTISNWIEFDIPDISVSIDEPYYIICKTTSDNQYNSYNWYEQTGDLYDRGAKYYSNDSGITWYQNPEYDFCFKTYGHKAELYIQYIKGGFGWNIYYGIKNIGTIATNNINVSITFSGGIILTKKTFKDNINQSITPGETLDKTLSPVIGFGPTEITITISSPNAQATSKTVQAFLFLLYIYISPE